MMRKSALKWARKDLPTPTRTEPSLCEMCGSAPKGRSKALCLDHCHETKTFRGWLCDYCNRGLGQLGDDLDVVIANLTRYRGYTTNG